MPETSTVTSIVDLQNNTNPPPLFDLGAMNIFSHLIFLIIFFCLASSVHVSAKNTTNGSFVHTKSASLFSVHGFPSPWQSHTKPFMAIGGADTQPPPLKKKNSHHPLKLICFCLVTLDDPPHLSFRILILLPHFFSPSLHMLDIFFP